MEILIRPWQQGDIPAVRRILWDSWFATYRAFIPERDLEAYFKTTYHPDALLRLYEAPFVHGLIGEAEGQAVGFSRTQYHENERRLYLASLYLKPGFQGRGIGGALLRAAEERARAYGLSELWVGVMVKNEEAGRWYERRGFRFLHEEPFRMAGTVVSHRIGVKAIAAALREAGPPGQIQAVFPGEGQQATLGDLCASLCESQQEAWPAYRQGCLALKQAQVRELSVARSRVLVQFNPRRIVSTGAAVDQEAIARRPCFLCRKQLPLEQRALLYRDSYLVLVNPAPIFPRHLTIAHLRHLPQRLAGHLETLLQLSADLGPGWVVFYNGPRCGASAPDHLHFQAAPSGFLPVEAEVARAGLRTRPCRKGDVTSWQTQGLGRGIVVLEGGRAATLALAVEECLAALRHDEAGEEEPLLNLLATRQADRWRLLLFPRRKHRPAAYFREGDGQRLISPGAVDMAGVLITPRERDFLCLDGPAAAALFAEVAYDDALTAGLLDR